jgi:glycosyltransferase involved in cell wall biosynthesis
MRSLPPTRDRVFERGSAVVCVLAAGADLSVGASDAPSLHIPATTAVVFAGSTSEIDAVAGVHSAEIVERATGVAVDGAGGTAEVVNAAIRATAPADLVLLVAGAGVGQDWLARLRAAAMSDSTVASATPLSLGPSTVDAHDGGEEGLGLSVPFGAGGSVSLAELARRVAARAEGLHPRIAGIGPSCAYIRRSALELAGGLDATLTLDAAMADLALRMIASGMVHVAADDVLVQSSPWASYSGPAAARGSVEETFVADERGRLRRATGLARTAVRRLSVTIDGRALTSTIGGTQTYIIELILALSRDSRVAVRVLTPPDLSVRATSAFENADVELLGYDDALRGTTKTDVVHRPQSIFTPDDLALLKLVGERIVIGQLDLIAYHNYTYHPDVDHWRAYRRTTRLALGGADQVIFFSEHARRDALAEDLLPEARAHVVSIGVDTLEHSDSVGTPPPGLARDEPFLLCLGADYEHKNRVFAIELLGALRELGWSGHLAMAGAHVQFGSSRERERVLLGDRPDLAALTHDLGPVDQATRTWLYRHARALLYPTLYEGFGLLPLEAARAQLPCLFAAQASLSEAAGDAATLVPWNAPESAAAVLQLLDHGPERDEHLTRLRALAIPTWGTVASGLLTVYQRALAAPPAEGSGRIWQELDRERYITTLDRDVKQLKETAQEYQDAYHSLSGRVASGLPLIDEGGLLGEAQQRGLMRIAARRRLSGPLLTLLGLLGRRTGDRPWSP